MSPQQKGQKKRTRGSIAKEAGPGSIPHQYPRSRAHILEDFVAGMRHVGLAGDEGYAELVRQPAGAVQIMRVRSVSDIPAYYLLSFVEDGRIIGLATVHERGWLGSVIVLKRALPPVLSEQQAAESVQKVTQTMVRSSSAAFAPGTLTSSTFIPFFVVQGAPDVIYYVSPYGEVFTEKASGVDGTIMLHGVRKRLQRIPQ